MSRSDKGTVLGNGTLWFPRLKRGEVCPDVAMAGLPVTAGMVARSCLEDLLKDSGRTRIGWNKQTMPMLLLTPPQFVRPSAGDFILWDIKSAYWSIYSQLSLDFQYTRETWGTGTVPYSNLPDWWAEEKLIRNCAIGCQRARSISVWDGSQIIQRSFYNKLLSPMVWGFICDFLNAIASEAHRLGAVYYNVDGGIWHVDRAEDALRWSQFVEELGLTAVCQYAGTGEILSGGNWTIGGERRGIGTVKRESSRFYDCPYALTVWRLNRLERRC